jgi:hypothetical protein
VCVCVVPVLVDLGQFLVRLLQSKSNLSHRRGTQMDSWRGEDEERLMLYTPAQNLALADYESISWRDDFSGCCAAW